MDKNGEIMLQVVAMLDGKSPKKSDLPKHINPNNYEKYADQAIKILEDFGAYATQAYGLGLDKTGKYLPYDAALAPMSIAYKFVTEIDDGKKQASAKAKLHAWFIGSALSQRYQEVVHGKQEEDLKDYKSWVDEYVEPGWITDVVITPTLRSASHSGAIGKLVVCTLNSKAQYDPALGDRIGYFDGAKTTEDHHIFPSKWAPMSLSGYDKSTTKLDIAMNIMLLSSGTNGRWLNFSPSDQVQDAIDSQTEAHTRDRYNNQFIDDESFEILRKPSLSVDDYRRFIELRYQAFSNEFSKYGFARTDQEVEEVADLEDPSDE